MNHKNQGVYKCIAVNIHGKSERDVKVTVMSRPLTVFIPQSEYSFIENQTDVEISCLVFPKSKADRISLKWLFGGTEIIADDDIYMVW